MPLTEERAISNWDIAHFFLSRSQSLIGKERAASTSRSPIRAVQGP